MTRKITRGLARVDAQLDECLYMGNLDSLRDWGHARDYVEMQWLMLQQDRPEDFVIATGRQESVRRFIELTAQELGWGPMQWVGEGTAEVGLRGDTGAVVVRIDPRYFRPAEVETLLGDPSKAKNQLGWTPKPPLRNSWQRWWNMMYKRRRKRPTSNGRALPWWEHGNNVDHTIMIVLRSSVHGEWLAVLLAELWSAPAIIISLNLLGRSLIFSTRRRYSSGSVSTTQRWLFCCRKKLWHSCK